MSAIYGSNNKKTFLELQKLNQGKRNGNNAMLFLSDDRYDVYKVHTWDEFKFPRKKYHTYLGITENKTKTFDPDNLNPSLHVQWIVSCCGTVTNKDEIIDNTDKSMSDSIAQTHAIVALLNYVYDQSDYIDSKVISEALSMVEGKYATWIHNCENGNVFIAKCNYELYADVYENTFSSEPMKGLEPLQDGELYQLTREGITPVSFFDYSDD